MPCAVGQMAHPAAKRGVIPQTTFLVNTPIVFDPVVPLYAAIGGSPRSFYAAGAGTSCGP